MLAGARAVLLAATSCQVRSSPAPHDVQQARSDRRPTVSEVGGFTPFPFITISNPTVDHTGVAARPGFSPTDPRSASFIDPMSGIEVFRLGGNLGSNVLINGTTDSGRDYPRKLRNENNRAFKVWNSDSTLLMIDRHFARSGDPANPCTSYLVDVDASHGASAPWRIVRVQPVDDLAGAFNPKGTSRAWWNWDPINPLRAYALCHDGRVVEWWPIGGSGYSVGEVNVLYGPLPSGYGSVHGADTRPGEITPDGQHLCIPCQRFSDGRWGGFKRNLLTGAFESNFVVSPDFNYTGSSLKDGDRAANGISRLAPIVTLSVARSSRPTARHARAVPG